MSCATFYTRRLPRALLRPSCHSTVNTWAAPQHRRSFLTLAIESSCDDTSVAVLETADSPPPPSSGPVPSARLLFHERATARTTQFRGIHPLHAHESHQASLPGLLQAARSHLGARGPDLVAATRGPGILACLQVGLNTAKGLAVAWGTPFVGAHHMQAHALTPRLEAALGDPRTAPTFPFVSALVSGGHTMLLHSASLTEHAVLASSTDIAVGDCLDKVGRAVLPTAALDAIPDAGYGRLLEAFAFPDGLDACLYEPPPTRAVEVAPRDTRWGWAVPLPTIAQRGLLLSFSGIETTVARIVARRGEQMEDQERSDLAREAMRAAFELVALRAAQALTNVATDGKQVDTLVVSGGVAANGYLKRVLRAVLDARGHAGVQLCFPRPELCTDNAAMIAWAAYEMYNAGWHSELNCPPIRRWSMDEGGLLCEGWKEREGFHG